MDDKLKIVLRRLSEAESMSNMWQEEANDWYKQVVDLRESLRIANEKNSKLVSDNDKLDRENSRHENTIRNLDNDIKEFVGIVVSIHSVLSMVEWVYVPSDLDTIIKDYGDWYCPWCGGIKPDHKLDCPRQAVLGLSGVAE
jgi:hypothetical protein